MTDPSKDIKDAFLMARGMIRICQQVGGPCMTERNGEPFYDCTFFKYRTCPARTFLDEHNQIDAWEVKT